jgi:hypothetical protein
MLTGRITSAIKRALRRETTRALEEQFFTFSPAQFANWPTILSHESFLFF